MVARLNLISAGQTVLSTHLVFHSLVTNRVSKVKLESKEMFRYFFHMDFGSSRYLCKKFP